MQVRLAYGRSYQELEVADALVKGVVKGSAMRPASEGQALVREALSRPVGSPSLGDLARARRPNSVVVIVNDVTRPTPYREILPPLLEELRRAGVPADAVTLLVATGIHRAMRSDEQRAIFGDDVCNACRIVNHDCDGEMADLGAMSNGWRLAVNRLVAEADLRVLTGVVGLHYFAGYSGGRKSILPGVAARTLIEANHAMMADERAAPGRYLDNPVHLLMTEAARRVGVDFILNVVMTADKRIGLAVAGDLEEAWLEAVRFCEAHQVVEVESKCDVVLASAGGYPKDINLYQAQKALDSAACAVRDGGVLVLVAECAEGYGEEVFAQWLGLASCPRDIVERFWREFELGGHKAYAICRLLERMEVVLVSAMDEDSVRRAFLTPAASLAEAWTHALSRVGPRPSVLVMPEAGAVALRVRSER
ncbi:MAG: nickel-dependent lactate racemase [Syntrophomonadaceae bacterium]|nr:nickel-dependent lactate racemase [Syntrophomonadaceae bacterium]